MEWRPFRGFVRTVTLPGNGRMTAHHELEPDGDGTRLRAYAGGERRQHRRTRNGSTSGCSSL